MATENATSLTRAIWYIHELEKIYGRDAAQPRRAYATLLHSTIPGLPEALQAWYDDMARWEGQAADETPLAL